MPSRRDAAFGGHHECGQAHDHVGLASNKATCTAKACVTLGQRIATLTTKTRQVLLAECQSLGLLRNVTKKTAVLEDRLVVCTISGKLPACVGHGCQHPWGGVW